MCARTKGFRCWLAGLLCVVTSELAQAQQQPITFRDSLDGAFDLSEFLLGPSGFIPIPALITEPALGGFGGALAPVFIRKVAPIIDSVHGKAVVSPVAPDITGIGGFVTLNGSWGIVGGRSGTFVKRRIKYLLVGGYAHVNISFFRQLPLVGEQEFQFNIQTFPVLARAMKRLGHSNWYIGLEYIFLQSKVRSRNEREGLPEFVRPIEINSRVSQPGIIAEYDGRDNVFSPDRGFKIHVDASRSDTHFGSDYNFWRINYFGYFYQPLRHNLIGSLRLDGQQVTGDPPFFLLPFVDLRGVAAARYQGKADILTEAELRWDFVPRWSAVLYGGAGKAFDDWSKFGEAEWVYNYGTGFRYLIARKFKLRMGLDLARGPDTWAYYVVFGSGWIK
jgi:hypothetical protein